MAKTGYVWDGTQFISISSPIAAVPNAVTSYNSIAPAVKTTRTNLITNPSIETGITGWEVWSCALSSVSTDSKFGTKCLKVDNNSTLYGGGPYLGPYPLTNLQVTVGRTYTFSGYVKDIDTSISHRAGIEWVSDAGTTVSVSYGTPTVISSSLWTRVSVTATAPNTATRARPHLYVMSPANGKSSLMDAFLFEESASVLDYFDGTNYSPITEAYPSSITTAWTGTANASTSTISYYKQSDVKIGQLWIDSSTMITYVYNGSAWVMASGSLPIDLNINTITSDYNIPVGSNGLSAGPITIGTGTTTMINLNSTWSII